MEDETPVVEVDPTNGVAEEQSSKGGLCACSHDFDVGFPVKLVIDEDAEVVHQRRSTNLESPATGNLQVERWPESSDEIRVGVARLECDKFSFVRV